MIVELAQVAAAEGCLWFDPVCLGGELIDVIADDAWAKAAEMFMGGWRQLEMFFFASWISMPLLIDINNPFGTTIWLQQILAAMTWFFAVLGALVTAGWTFIKLGPEKVKNLGVRLTVLLLISTSGGLIITAVDWLAKTASVGLLLMVGVDTKTTFITEVAKGISPSIPMIVAIVATIGVIIQWGIMLARGPLVALLVGVWPLSAAASTLGVKKGEESFDIITAWLLAFVLYPFPAALVYAAAFRMKTGGDGLGGLLYGFILEMLALFLLPAILRLIAPQAQALGKAFGGEIALKGAAQALEVAVAVGAAVVTAGAAAGMIGAKVAGAAKGLGAASAPGGAGAAGPGPSGASPGPTTPSPTPGPGAAGASGGDSGSAAPATRGQHPGTAAPTHPGPGGGAKPGTGVAPGNSGSGSTAPGPASSSGGAPTRPGAPGNDSAPAPGPRPEPAGGAPSAPQQSPSPQGTAATSEAPRRPNRRYSAAPRAQAGAQAAQAMSNNVRRATQDGLDDVDEIIGGKNV